MELNKIWNMDCLDGMKMIPDGSVDCIICDLPYGTTACAWDNIIPFEPLWAQYKRVCKPNAAIVLFATEPFTSKLICSNMSMFKEKLTWVKHKPSNFGNAKIRHLKYTEDVCVFAINNIYTFNPQYTERLSTRVAEAQKGKSKNWCSIRENSGEVSFGTKYEPREWTVYDAKKKLQGNVLNYPCVVSNSKEKCDHPTQKPVSLIQYLIRAYSNDGETILDNCMGSGTTAIACIKEKRNFIGFELDKEYYNKACKRIKAEQAQLTLF